MGCYWWYRGEIFEEAGEVRGGFRWWGFSGKGFKYKCLSVYRE